MHYGLAKEQTKEITSIGQLVPSLVGLLTDGLFCSSIHRFSREFSKAGGKVLNYHFDHGNPFPGPMHGIPHHALDLEYVFGNYRDGFKDKKDVELSNEIMKRWISFANGKEDWEDYTSGKALRITPEGDLEVIPRDKVTTRRWAGYAEMEKNWTEVTKIGDILISGRKEAANS
jgi:carboxylesterase type B